MKSYQYGSYVMGWIPGTQQSGGRFAFFKDKTEYEAVYRKVTMTARQKELDKLIAKSGISGGKVRYSLAYRSGR